MQVSTNQNSHNKYILMTGAPGSKWSSVARTIYFSPDVDRSDASTEREYNKHAHHTGAYWDPGMEFGIEREEWDKPFSGTGYRIIKSHTFAHELRALRYYAHPIVMVYRNDFECMNQWMAAGGFDITYPNYRPYYKDPENMYRHIVWQNRDIMDFIQDNRKKVKRINSNLQLCDVLGIRHPTEYPYPSDNDKGYHNYHSKDVTVYVYQ